MKMNGGYIMADCTGLNLALDTAQEIPGIWDKAVKAQSKIGRASCRGRV